MQSFKSELIREIKEFCQDNSESIFNYSSFDQIDPDCLSDKEINYYNFFKSIHNSSNNVRHQSIIELENQFRSMLKRKKSVYCAINKLTSFVKLENNNIVHIHTDGFKISDWYFIFDPTSCTFIEKSFQQYSINGRGKSVSIEYDDKHFVTIKEIINKVESDCNCW